MAVNEGAAQGLSEREEQIYRWRAVNRLTYKEICARLNDEISEARVSQIMTEIRKKLPPIDLAEIRRESFAMYDDVKRRAMHLAEMEGAPVTSGKDGMVVIDPESGQVVRDYSGRTAALKLAMEADKEMRKLHGLDAAQKVEHSGSVRYEVAGIDPAVLS